MLKIRKILGGLIKSSNEKELEKLKFYVNKINELEPHYKKFSLDQFSIKTAELRSKLEKKIELDDLLPDAFACVREAAKRTLGERHFDVQLLGGIVLHQGKIAEMKTGEGKTLVSTLPAYLNALSQNGVHIVTVNDYLAKRDAEWMGKIYKLLGLSVGCISNELDDVERKKNYNCDITYSTNNELGFDYLRDNMKHSLDEMVQRQHNFCIVDEVDSILIDESRTPLIISGAVEDKSDKYFVSNKITKFFKKEDYNLDEKNKSAILTDIGIDKIEKYFKSIGVLKNNNFYDPENISLVHHINQALRANFLFSKDKDYIIRDNKVQIIDEFTGRVLEGRRFSEGLHQALEAKENVEIQSENQTLASITYQNYFRLYKKLSGMTGTAMTEAEEFYDIYKLKTFSIPTNKKMMIYNRQKNNQEQDAHNYMNILNKNLEQIYSTEDRRITLEDLEMNQLRSRFEEELELLGEFTRVIGREINVEPNREYIFTDRILGYLRELRTRYSGLSIREIIDREINSSLILEQSSSFIPGRNGQEPYPLIIHQIHFQGLIEHSVNMIRSSQWPRAQQTIPRRTGDERREYYFRRSRLFNEQEQELGIIMAFFELHLDRLDLLNRLTRRGHRIRNIRFDGNIPWADLWIRLRNRRNVGDVGDEIFAHADIWRDFIRNELNRVDHFNPRWLNPDDEAEGVN